MIENPFRPLMLTNCKKDRAKRASDLRRRGWFGREKASRAEKRKKTQAPARDYSQDNR